MEANDNVNHPAHYTVKDEVEICLTCDLPKCRGDDRLCKRYQAMIKELKERNKKIKEKER